MTADTVSSEEKSIQDEKPLKVESRVDEDVNGVHGHGSLKSKGQPGALTTWWRVLTFKPLYAPPPPASLHDAKLSPEVDANLFSLLWFSWMTPILSLGYARPLEATDLYKMQDDRASALIAKRLLDSFKRRQKDAQEYNDRLARGEISPGIKRLWWTLQGKRKEREKQWREKGGKKKASLILAMNDSIKWWFWIGGIFKVIGDTAQITSPLIVKAIINFATESYYAHDLGVPAPPVGRGIGLSFGLLALQFIGSWGSHHFFYRSMSSGVLLRGGLITAIYSRSLRLTSRARSTLSNGRLVNHISTDVSRIDFCMGWFHMVWAAPIQLIVCLILLLVNLGPSALAGYALFIICSPGQTVLLKQFFSLRVKSMSWTDKRSKLLQELLSGMRVIKFFGWELPFLKRISEYRYQEMKYIRTLLIFRAGMNAFAISLPALATVLAFITYSLTGHSLNAATIFSSLTLFQLVRMPLMFLPLALSSISDAATACERLYDVFVAETMDEDLIENHDLDVALRVKGADFTWDSPPPRPEDPKKKGKGGKGTGQKPGKKGKKGSEVPAAPKPPNDQDIFKLYEIDMEIPRGQLVAIVGAVGSGKTSLLQGLIGEMRRTAGTVEFGGSVGYCAQTAWIQNATIRENILFGQPFDEDRYWHAVRASCLEPDLDMLPNYDLTEVGEKGISLSGGQKQRINICRSIYCDSDIQIFDDPLSALDAHVGKAVFKNVIKENLQGKTRILVTHALHFLPHVDFIYTLLDGKIAERGTYQELMANDGAFSKFISEFGSTEEAKKEEEEEAVAEMKDAKKSSAAAKGLMQEEERNTGAIKWQVYSEYISAGHGLVVVPLLIVSLALMQGSSVMSSYWLVYWEERKWHQSSGFYMGIYAGLGVSQALTMFFNGALFAMLTYFASQKLHARAINRVMYAPMSFFETTPLGRIMNRFAKDIDTVDNTIGDALRMLAATLSQIIGAIILISIIIPWFLIIMACIIVCYTYAAIFYRSSARELKRLDAILRSSLYSHFSESLSGLTTIRAYGEIDRFRLENEERVDIENRAYWMTVTNQRWLGMRLDFLGIILTFAVALLTVGTRFTISPGQIGVVLSYIVMVQQSFGWMVRQTAEVENNMNSVERVLHYANEVEQEAPHVVENSPAPANWPTEGKVELNNVVMKYRPELPAVLKGISMSIAPGEKIGVVGRTGAGKSSIMTALYRMVEITEGSIIIDGVDTSKVGLNQLRTGLSIIPQDAVISGTLRTNLDPFGLHDDAKLWDALKRAYLVDSLSENPTITNGERQEANRSGPRFTLDSHVDDEGSNLSVGQRSLVSLARALVNETKVLILDEATASVDYETDRKIQDTIATEFRGRTILCIAHRLRTIISYDRICVLDAGTVAEFDTPSALFQKTDSIFRGMCDQSMISWDDIQNASSASKQL
ncbi:ABC transporter [Coniophora puteana RWD-64-598 SS2]|uniref:ABC transporter n=1 Tax=Coniophora puteana (strain RWD-64-598) TaxID=741705 RepID=A0A5M3MYV2_CONPW|nr:ABC transporter [Coniophora puteana RWD-64-598 SS2]EIW84207.1 ABC transporter [Coniophora puteana RWD-64-598 SS2]